jgi:hypothetical protein
MELEQLMRDTGYTGNDPEEGMAHVWKAMPTDAVGELIDQVAQRNGLKPPFPQQGGQMKLGGPESRTVDNPAYSAEMERQARRPSPAFGMYDRMTTALENNQPGAERAFGPVQDHLRSYYQARGNALMNRRR